jgi:hypothetical protein
MSAPRRLTHLIADPLRNCQVGGFGLRAEVNQWQRHVCNACESGHRRSPAPCTRVDSGASEEVSSSSPNCGRRLIHHRREAVARRLFQLKPREDYAPMKAKTIFSTSNGQTSRLWRSGHAICQGSVLPKLPIRAKLNLNRPVIWWMSAKTSLTQGNGHGYDA